MEPKVFFSDPDLHKVVDPSRDSDRILKVFEIDTFSVSHFCKKYQFSIIVTFKLLLSG